MYCHLFLISSDSVRSIPFLSFIVPIFAWNVPLVSLNFLEEISDLSHSIVFLYFFALISEGRLSYLSMIFFGTLHSNGFIFPFILCLSLLSFSQIFVRPPQTTIMPFCISFFGGWSWSLPPVQCHEPLATVFQALYQFLPLESIFHFHCITNAISVWLPVTFKRAYISGVNSCLDTNSTSFSYDLYQLSLLYLKENFLLLLRKTNHEDCICSPTSVRDSPFTWIFL